MGSTRLVSDCPFAASGTTWYHAAISTGYTRNATEANAQTTYRTAGTFSKLQVKKSSGDRTGMTTTIRLDGVNGNQIITYTSADVVYEDTTNVDTIAANTKVCFKTYGGTGGTTNLNVRVASILWTPANVLETINVVGYTPEEDNITSASTVYFAPLCGRKHRTTTVAITQWLVSLPPGVEYITLRNLFARTTANTSTNAITVAVDGATGAGTAPNLSVTGGSGAAFFEDTSNSIKAVDGDLLSFKITTSTGTVSCVFSHISIEVVSSQPVSHFMAMNANGNGGTSGYAAPSGWVGNGAPLSTEAYFQVQLGLAGRISNLRSYDNAGTGHVHVRAGGADVGSPAALSIGSAGSTVGFNTDSLNSYLTTETSLVNYHEGSSSFSAVSTFDMRNSGDSFNRTLSTTSLGSTNGNAKSDPLTWTQRVGTLGIANTTDYSTEVLADTPTIFWRLGDSSGTTAVDSSGNSRDGTYTNTPTLANAGLIIDNNTAVGFASASSEYVTRASQEGIISGVSAYTLEAWIKPTTLPNLGSICGYENTNVNLLRLAPTGDTVGLVQFVVNSEAFTSVRALEIGVVYHVVGVYDGADAKIYINGRLDKSSTKTGTVSQAASSSFDAGRAQGVGRYWNGDLDEIAIYSTALSSARVLAHYDAGTKGRAYASAVSGGNGIATVDSGSPNVDVAVKASTAVANPNISGVVFRYLDTDNYWVWQGDTTDSRLWKKVAGSFTQVGSTQAAIASGDVLRVRVSASNISTYTNGTLKITTTDSFNSNETDHGFRTTDTVSRFEDFNLTNLPIANVATPANTLQISNTVNAVVAKWAYQHVILADSPVAYWRLGEFYGTNAIDASGNGNTGTYRSGTTKGTAGSLLYSPDTAVTVDGTTNGYVDRTGTSLPAPFSIECWVKISGATDGAFISQGWTNGASLGVGNTTFDNSGTNILVANENTAWVATTTTLTTGVWHHLVCTYSTGNKWRIYLDGAAVTITANQTSTIGSTGTRLSVGGYTNGASNRYAAAVIDEAAWYNVELTSTQILAHYTAGLTQFTSVADTDAISETVGRVVQSAKNLNNTDQISNTTLSELQEFGQYTNNRPNTDQISAVAAATFSRHPIAAISNTVSISNNLTLKRITDQRILTVANQISNTVVAVKTTSAVKTNSILISNTVAVVRTAVEFDTWRPVPNPDNTLVLVCRTPTGQHDSYTGTTNMILWTLLPDGTQEEIAVTLPAANGWVSYSHPEWSPDGNSIVIAAETATAYEIVILNATRFGL